MIARLLWLVWNTREGRPRALVRIGFHGAMLAIVLFVVGRMSRGLSHTPFGVALTFGLEISLVLGVTWVAARGLDRRAFADLGLRVRRGTWLDLAFGVFVGAICIGAIAIAEIALGWATYDIRRDAWSEIVPATGNAFVVFAAVAIVEEVVSRGYHLINLAEGLACGPGPHRLATVGALVISSCVFGLGHAWNPSATPAAVACIAVGGVFLAIGRLTQGDLAIPVGAHFGWNYVQNLLDMPVSGQDDYAGAALLDRQELGPDFATGGAFGPEGGVSGFVALCVGIALTLAWVRLRQGRIALDERIGVAPRACAGLPIEVSAATADGIGKPVGIAPIETLASDRGGREVSEPEGKR